MNRWWVGLWVIFLTVLWGVHGQANITIYVNASSSFQDPSSCGTSWAQACRTLIEGVQVACDSSPEGSLVLVAPGDYVMNSTMHIPCALHLQ